MKMQDLILLNPYRMEFQLTSYKHLSGTVSLKIATLVLGSGMSHLILNFVCICHFILQIVCMCVHACVLFFAYIIKRLTNMDFSLAAAELFKKWSIIDKLIKGRVSNSMLFLTLNTFCHINWISPHHQPPVIRTAPADHQQEVASCSCTWSGGG